MTARNAIIVFASAFGGALLTGCAVAAAVHFVVVPFFKAVAGGGTNS